jgi:hypothetical protein
MADQRYFYLLILDPTKTKNERFKDFYLLGLVPAKSRALRAILRWS